VIKVCVLTLERAGSVHLSLNLVARASCRHLVYDAIRSSWTESRVCRRPPVYEEACKTGVGKAYFRHTRNTVRWWPERRRETPGIQDASTDTVCDEASSRHPPDHHQLRHPNRAPGLR